MKRYDRHNAQGDQWLSDQMEPALVDVSGIYTASGWGKCLLVQNGREVRGHIGDYPVTGVVSGEKVYLLISEGGWYYYSAILEMPREGFLVGYYARAIPFRRSARVSLQLIPAE